MMFKRDDSGSKISAEWHRQRQLARETAFSIDSFGAIEIEKYDLDTARITGDENPKTYKVEQVVEEDGMQSSGTDIRTLDWH
jgi:hypothetical protein